MSETMNKLIIEEEDLHDSVVIDTDCETTVETTFFPDDDTKVVGDDTNVVGDDTNVVGDGTNVVGDDTDVVGDDTDVVGDDTDVVDDDTNDDLRKESIELASQFIY